VAIDERRFLVRRGWGEREGEKEFFIMKETSGHHDENWGKKGGSSLENKKTFFPLGEEESWGWNTREGVGRIQGGGGGQA